MPALTKTMMGAAAALLLGLSMPAMAQNGAPLPPLNPGGVALDLAGTSVSSATGFVQYTASFTASNTTSMITFGMRNDPGYFLLDGVSVVDHTGGVNLISNGNFSSGMTGWSYFSFVAPTGQVIDASGTSGGFPLGFALTNNATILDSATPSISANFVYGSNTSQYAYTSNAIGGYDYLSQSFDTESGHTYDVSFWLFDTCQLGGDVTVCDTGPYSSTQYSAIDPNDALYTGRDLLLYAPDQVPEPASMAIMAAGLIGLGAARRARRRAA